MTREDKAKAVALAKLLGSTLSTSELLEQYSHYYQEAIDELGKDEKPSTVTSFKRPF